MKRLLQTTALAMLIALPAHAQEITVGASNLSSYLDPGRDHSNVGSQFYYNVFDVLIERESLGRTRQFAEINLDGAVPAGALVRARVSGHDGRRLSGEVAA